MVGLRWLCVFGGGGLVGGGLTLDSSVDSGAQKLKRRLDRNGVTLNSQDPRWRGETRYRGRGELQKENRGKEI